jgi:LuxR family transcriptional regulator, quorum-sensing system regulator BjaR1
MDSNFHRNLTFDTIADISHLNSLPQVAAALGVAVAKLGFTSLGINGLPAPSRGANPVILAENTPEGFRDCYIEERFYHVDHIGAHARAVYSPYRYDEAPYDRTKAPVHQRFLQALDTFCMSKGLVVPVGRPANIPACVWLAGENPDLRDDAVQATQLIALFAASKAVALSRPPSTGLRASNLTPDEREVLQWISAGKTSWEIGAIKGLSERAINKTIAEAMIKLDAVTRAQAVVNAIRVGEIEF